MSIGRQEFIRRRKRLMGAMEPDSIAILPAALETKRNKDVDYPFRQNSDFWYLTGFPEPEAVVALIPGRPQGEYVLFCRDKDRAAEVWTGFRHGPEGAVANFDADDAFPIGDIDDILPGLIEGRERVYYNIGQDADFDGRIMGWINRIRAQARMGAHPPGEFLTLNHLLHDMRLVKSAAEIKLMKKAGEISAAAHVRAMRAVKPGMFEYQLEAEYLHEFLRQGARSPAYPSIVGGGANGCVLHYVENSAKLKEGDLVLVDAAGEYDNYAADITRTYPVNGKFSAPQQALYEVVLEAQLAAIGKAKPDCDWNAGHEAAVTILTQGLKDLGLLKGEVKELVEAEAYRPFYMHRTGHWLGLDVHDVGDYKVDDQWRQLEPGMVLTAEPGLYVAPDAEVDAKWRGIGIRIEDDVLVTAKGPEVLTSGVPKRIADIEKLMARA
jgi:Xaa-Pro aminopeptidase